MDLLFVSDKLIKYYLFSFWGAHLGLGLNLCHSSNLGRCCNNTGYLTSCATSKFSILSDF